LESRLGAEGRAVLIKGSQNDETTKQTKISLSFKKAG